MTNPDETQPDDQVVRDGPPANAAPLPSPPAAEQPDGPESEAELRSNEAKKLRLERNEFRERAAQLVVEGIDAKTAHDAETADLVQQLADANAARVEMEGHLRAAQVPLVAPAGNVTSGASPYGKNGQPSRGWEEIFSDVATGDGR